MTPQEFAKLQRDFLIRIEKQSAVVILYEFNKLKEKIDNYITVNLTGQISVNKLQEKENLDRLLNNLELEVQKMVNPATKIIMSGQEKVINFVATELPKYAEIQTSIYEKDTEALQKLIERTKKKSTLTKAFQEFAPAIREKAKEVLIQSFDEGLGYMQIASNLQEVTDMARWKALTIARTETNEAYRAATRDFYQQAEIEQYVWMSILDPRTCLICWSLHGRKFKSSKKAFSHPNCRCTLVPYFGQEIISGSEVFAKLEKGYQKQILGKGRFELYENGDSLRKFVSSKTSKEYGQRFFVKPLSSFKPKIGVAQTSHINAEKAKSLLKNIHNEYGAEYTRLNKELLLARGDFSKYSNNAEVISQAKKEGRDISNREAFVSFRKEKLAEAVKRIKITENELAGMSDKYRDKALDVVRVQNPANLQVSFKSKFTGEEQTNIKQGVSEFNSLVDERFLKNETFAYKKTKDNRSYYSGKEINLSAKARTKEGLNTIIHETAHGLEQSHPKILQAALDFWEHRTKGEEFVKLSKATGLNYDNKEICKIDNFSNPYDGKEPYHIFKINPKTGLKEKKYVATEIITRGMEYLYQDPTKFALEQPEYFDFIFKTLRGQKWQPR